MTKKLLTTLLLVCLFPCIQAQTGKLPQYFANKWWLAVIPAANLPINMTFEAENDSIYPVLYSPTQDEEPINVSRWSFSNDTLTCISNRLRFRITILYDRNANSFAGTFRQNMSSTKIQFTPANGLYRDSRPQEPKAPFSFDEESVTIENGEGSVSLSGTLTIPKNGSGRFPAVVLVSGSGLQDRNEELFGHKPFLLLAEYFAQRGIAVLRYDDRGCGLSIGNAADATTFDFANDAEAMFNFLAKHKKIDKKRVGIIGHSEGALIAQIVASRNKNVKFIVSYAGQGYNGTEILLQQNRMLFEMQNFPDSVIESRINCMKDFFAIADTAPENRFIELFKNTVRQKAGNLSKEQLSLCGLDGSGIFVLAKQLQNPWMKAFLQLDPKDYLPKISCRILAVGGSHDLQVPARENLARISELTNGRATVRNFEGLNHLFQHCTPDNSLNYRIIEETTSPEVMKFVADWILEKQTK